MLAFIPNKIQQKHALMSVLTELFQLIFFKRKAQDISFSIEAAVVSFIAFLSSNYVFYSLVYGQYVDTPFIMALLLTVLLSVMLYLVLSLARKPARFVQMVTAMFGVSAILQFLGLSLLFIPSVGIISLALSLLNIVLMIVIVRDTLETKTAIAMLIVFFTFFGAMQIVNMMFPEFQQAQQQAMQATLDAMKQANQ